MNVSNLNTYHNSIYTAVIVEVDEDNKIYQVYIPAIHASLKTAFEAYVQDSNKSQSTYRSYFPWASSLIEELEIGTMVYITFVNNDISNILIIGEDQAAAAGVYGKALGTGAGGSILVATNGVLDLAMPIILNNEVGIPLNAYPNNISDSYYGKINPYDNGGWSIGLIQWHHGRAFDTCYEICKADSNWKNYFDDKELSLYKSLEKAIKNNSTLLIREKFGSSFHPVEGSSNYKAIKKLLTSAKGKEVQLKLACADTQKAIDNLMNYYEIENPAIIIYVTDIMNQYGYYVDQTKKAASTISKNGKGTMAQLDEMVEWCKKNLGSYYTYQSRRDKVYRYIVELEKQGKLSATNLCDIEGANEGGQLLWPAPTCKSITSPYGWRGAIAGTSHTSSNFHKGIDLSKSGGSGGEIIIAVAAGTVTTASLGWNGGYGNYTVIDHGNGLTTRYAHQESITVKKGDTVQAGQVIGYIDSTGNSSGSHLHFEVRINGDHKDPLPYIRKS